MMKTQLITIASFLTSGCMQVQGFYLPGVNPQSFAQGDPVKLKVNKLTSSVELLPLDYYRLPFCAPDGGPKLDHENLGEFLAGDRIENSPYRLAMKEDMICEQLCVAHLGPPETSPETKKGKKAKTKKNKKNRVAAAIRRQYHANWIIDNLPSAAKVEDDTMIETSYSSGFPIGFIESDVAYVHNHVNIEIQYHQVELEEGKNRIVKFIVEPFSISHAFKEADDDDDDDDDASEDDDKKSSFKPVNILNPIESCEERNYEKHTNYDMLAERPKQLASGRVLFTYDVIWTENTELHWASRWDVYLDTENPESTKVHWVSIFNSLIVIVILSTMVAAILVRNVRSDYARYNRLSTDEELDTAKQEIGWKLVHADVFRPPQNAPMLLAICCGTGVQLIFMVFITMIFAYLGFLSPANRGSLMTALLLFYVLMGVTNGYTTARLYKAMKGKSWQKATTFTAMFFPTIAFSIFSILNLVALIQGSSDAVPFSTILVLLFLWFGLCTPLVFLGAYFGYRADAIEFPVNTSNIAREIPHQPWYLNTIFAAILSGILPFSSCFVEVYFVLSSLWMNQYYYIFGFLLLSFILLFVTCAELVILFHYVKLCCEDYQWWWRSFLFSATTSGYVFVTSTYYFSFMESNSFATYMLYFGYMFLASFGIALMSGVVGVLSCLLFNITIFGSIKIE